MSIWDSARTTVALIKTYLGTDVKEDMPASKSAINDIRAEDWNLIVGGLAETAIRNQYGMLACYTFSQADATASQTAVTLARNSANDADVTTVVAPLAGRVVGLGVAVEAARSAGTLTINIEVNGTPITISCVIDGTNTQYFYTMQTVVEAVAASDVFTVGQQITATVTTDGAWAAGVTPSITVDVYLALGY